MADADAIQVENEEPLEGKPHPHRKRNIIIGVVCAVVVVLVAAAAVVGFMLYRGALAPAEAAAKYDTLSYIQEDDVTDYINTYRKQLGYEGDDEQWGQFLASYGMTPALLRQTTVRQLIIDDEVAKKAQELGVEASDEELDAYIDYMKNQLGMGSDEIWQQTLQTYGQTEEGLREAYSRTLIEEGIFEKEVPVPTPTDDELLSYMESNYSTGQTIKHIYYCTVEGLDEGSSYEKLEKVQSIRKALVEGDAVNKDTFAAVVNMYCSDDDLISRGGANGWSIDMDDYSDNYQAAVEDTKVGQVSEVFKDTNGYSFVWIDTKYKLPNISKKMTKDSFDGSAYLADIPDTLKSYFSDLAAKVLWQTDCQEYLNQLYENSNPVVFDMPMGLDYDVDVSQYMSTSTDSDDSDATESGSGTNADAKTSSSGE